MDVFRHMIDNDYRVHWMMDGLPVVVRSEDGAYVTRGYPIGFSAAVSPQSKSQHYLFNHVRIIVRYNEVEDSGDVTRIVGFEVIPFSIKVGAILKNFSILFYIPDCVCFMYFKVYFATYCII